MNNSEDKKKCSHCKRTFLISTHFQSFKKPEGTKMCLKCRNGSIKSRKKPTSAVQKRRKFYLFYKRNKIENSRKKILFIK